MKQYLQRQLVWLGLGFVLAQLWDTLGPRETVEVGVGMVAMIYGLELRLRIGDGPASERAA